MAVVIKNQDSTVTLSFASKVRTFSVNDVWGDGKKLVSERRMGVCKHRTGKKLYPVRMEFWLKDSGYVLQTRYCCINKQATLTGWLEDYFGEELCGLLTERNT